MTHCLQVLQACQKKPLLGILNYLQKKLIAYDYPGLVGRAGLPIVPGRKKTFQNYIAHAQVDPNKLGAPLFNLPHRIPHYQKVSLKK